MKKNKIHKFIFIFFFLISNSLVDIAHATFLESGDTVSTANYEVGQLDVENEEGGVVGVTFNNNGTKMYIVGETNGSDGKDDDIHEYILSTPYDISTATFSVAIDHDPSMTGVPRQIRFNKDGSRMFIGMRDRARTQHSKIFQYELSEKFSISSATYNGVFFHVGNEVTNVFHSFGFNQQGTMLYASDGSFSVAGSGVVHQYSLSVAFDLSSTITFLRSQDLEALADTTTARGAREPSAVSFNQDGTRMFLVESTGNEINQYTLSEAFNIATASFDGGLRLGGNPSGLALSPSGLKMYIASNRFDNPNYIEANGVPKFAIREFNLPCPFSLFAGGCQPITEGDRTGMAEAQINIAKRTIEHSTDAALNRLKWIRRNKDLQNLSMRNIKLNFSNQMLDSLTEVIQASTTTKEKSKNKDIFYWAEGTLAFGKVRETDTSSKKKIYTDGITIGADKFTDDQGIKGLAFRFSQNDVIVGSAGSKLDTDTYNLTHYSTTPIKDDSRFLDSVVGIGFLQSNISSVLDGNKLTGNRNGRQIYGTLKLKEEIEKDNLTLIPAVQIDLGYSLLSNYSESGKSAMRFDKQSIQSRNLRLSLASVEQLNNEKYKIKRHGKIEYQANLHRSSNIKYSYINDSSSKFDTELNSGALHNINGEIGFDVIYDDNFSLFFIYEHNEAFSTGYTGKIHLAIGYLPQKNTNFAFKIEGDDILKSKYIYTKNVNGLDINFYLLNNNAMRPETFDEIALNLRKVF